MSPEIKEYMSLLGKRSLVTMTPEQRKERARKAGLSKGKNKKNERKNNEQLDVQP